MHPGLPLPDRMHRLPARQVKTNIFIFYSYRIQMNTFRSAMRSQMLVSASSQATSQRDELAEWLAQPPVPTEDPLHWWLANKKLYPRLSRMAIDFHGIPGEFF